MSFNDMANWIQFGTGTIVRKEDSFDVSLASGFSGLRSATPLNLNNGAVTINLKKSTARAGIIIRPSINDVNPQEDGIRKYGFLRAVNYGIMVYDGSGWPFLGSDPKPEATSEELKIQVLANGQIGFFLDGVQIYAETPKSALTNLYVYYYAETATQGTATFSTTTIIPPPTMQTLTILSSVNGSTNPSAGSYLIDKGTIQTISAGANTGYEIDHWTKDGVTIGSETGINVLMDADHTISITFRLIVIPPTKHTITVNSTPVNVRPVTIGGS